MKIYFLQVVSCGPISCWQRKFLRRLGGMAVPTRKAVLEETCLALGCWLACCLPWLGELLLPCEGYQAQYCPADVASADNQTGLPIGLALARSHHRLALGVFRVTRPTPLRVAPWGPQKEFFTANDRRAAIRWIILGDPWKACSLPHKIGQSPTWRFLTKNPQLVDILVCLEGSLSAFL